MVAHSPSSSFRAERFSQIIYGRGGVQSTRIYFETILFVLIFATFQNVKNQTQRKRSNNIIRRFENSHV